MRYQDAISKGTIRLHDPVVATELACQNERANWVASRAGLPPIGSKLVNQHGIEWVVQNHAAVPTVDTLERWRKGDVRPDQDLYPVIAPQNLSPRLMEFFHAIDRCTTKTFAMLDTMPGRRKDGHVPGGNSIDTLSHPLTNLIFLDAARVNETIIAHEFGHAWVQYVDECEDLRTMEDASDPQRMRMVSFIQSFVLDLKVNDLLRRKGFDMSPIEDDKAASIHQLALALQKDYKPEHPREEVFMALLLADQLLASAQVGGSELAPYHQCFDIIRNERPALAALAEKLSSSVSRHGISPQASIVACIDECLTTSFEFCGESLDLEHELVLLKPEEPDLDKFPKWLPALPPGKKCVVGKHMARHEISSDWMQFSSPGLTERTKVEFRSPDGQRYSRVMVDHHIGPPTPYYGMNEDYAEMLELKRQNESRSCRQAPYAQPNLRNGGITYNANYGNAHGSGRRHGPMGPAEAHIVPNLPGRTYMPGIGRFLTAVRLAEQLEGEHPYAYALNNPISYTDPSGLQPDSGLRDVCKKRLDECMEEAHSKWDYCLRKALARFNYDMKACNLQSEPLRSVCQASAMAKLVAAQAGCGAKHDWRYGLCNAQYMACKEGQEAARKVVYCTIAAVGAYCVYRGCKAAIGVLTAPVTGPGAAVIIWSP